MRRFGRGNALWVATLLLGTAGAAGCVKSSDDDPSGTDGGTIPDGGNGADGGADASTDAGTDGGIDPSMRASVRLAHLSPNAPSVRLCVEEGPGLFLFDAPIPSGAIAANGLGFGSFSDYVELNTTLSYTVRVYPAAALDTWNEGRTPRCPTTEDTNAPASVLEVGLSDLTVGAYYTMAAVGLVRVNGTLPAVCGNSGTPCPDTVELDAVLYEEDATPVSSRLTLRAIHTVPNAPAIDVCVIRTTNSGVPDTAERIAENLAYPNSGAYAEIDAVLTGLVSLHTHDAQAEPCDASTEIGVVEVPFEIDPMAGPGVTGTFDAGTVVSLYVNGLADEPLGVAITAMQDGP